MDYACTRPGCSRIVRRTPGNVHGNVYCSRECYYAYGAPRAAALGVAARRAAALPDYAVDSESDCWVWMKSRPRGRYGVKWLWSNGRKRSVQAHRWYYEQARGPIPAGLEIDHLCLNKACVNPDHLEVVTRTENRRRRSTVTYAQVREVRARGMGCAEAARFLGVSEPAASKIVRGETWAE